MGMGTIYEFEVKKPDGTMQSLRDYEGKTLLVVNTASKCGLAPQFKGLKNSTNKDLRY